MTTILIEGIKNNPHVLILVVVLIGLLIAAYVFNRIDKRRGQDGESVIGLKPISTSGFWDYVGKKRFSVLSPWVAPVSIAEAYQGNYNGVDVCLFQIGLPEGAETPSPYQTAVHIRGINLPHFVLKPSGIVHKISELFGKADITFPAFPNFNDSYTLKGENEGRIRSLFQPHVINFFTEHEGITIESNGNSFLIYKYQDQGKRDNYANYIDRALNILEFLNGGQLKPQVAESFSGDKPEIRNKKRMTAAFFNFVANGFIITMVYYQIGGVFAHIIAATLILESIGFFLYTSWKKKEISQGRV